MKISIPNRLVVCSLLTLFLPGHGISQSPASQAQPSWVTGSAKQKVEVEVTSEVRTARAQAFDDKHGRMKPLDHLESVPYERGATIRIADRTPSEPLPVRNSDSVVVATVTGYKSFLSSDRSSVFTELYLNCDKVLKDATNRIDRNRQITILKRGGMVVVGDQKLTTPRVLDGSEPLDIGSRYVLFLKYRTSLDSYTDVDGWRLTIASPVPLVYSQRVAIGSNNDLLAYSQDTENQFLQAIQEKIDSAGVVK
jgi:hypothetical protein